MYAKNVVTEVVPFCVYFSSYQSLSPITFINPNTD